MLQMIVTLYRKFEKILTYLFFSVLSTILDTLVVWIFFQFLGIDLTIANTIGIISGFFLHYFLSAKTVFHTQYNLYSFIIYLGTSGVGLLLANFLIANTYSFAVKYTPVWLAFLFGKGVSVLVPFFVMYFIRKYLYILLERNTNHE